MNYIQSGYININNVFIIIIMYLAVSVNNNPLFNNTYYVNTNTEVILGARGGGIITIRGGGNILTVRGRSWVFKCKLIPYSSVLR
jgi:hypothetical protein